MTYVPVERPPTMEGMWFCKRCMMLRAFQTTVELEGKDAPDAPLFCAECDWELLPETDVVAVFPDPPVVQVRRMDAAQRAAGKELWRKHLLSISAPKRGAPEALPSSAADFAMQLAQLQGEKGRRL